MTTSPRSSRLSATGASCTDTTSRRIPPLRRSSRRRAKPHAHNGRARSHEQKLVNEYNSVSLGVITGEEAETVKAAYLAFLAERRTLKAAVEADCDEQGLPED